MAEPFNRLHFNVADSDDESVQSVRSRPLTRRGAARGLGDNEPDAGPAFNNEESAARFYLGQLMGQDRRSAVRGLTAEERPAVVPDMRLRDSKRSPLTGTWMVRFVQTKASIPVFGSSAVVELDANRELLGVDAALAEVGNVSPVAALSPMQALEKIATATKARVESLTSVAPPELNYFHDTDRDQWHLAYYFRHVPAAPDGFVDGMRTHGIGHSRAQHSLELNYLVDAHDGAVLMYWSSAPTADIPARCKGTDEEGVARDFFGRVRPEDQAIELSDPMRKIRTYDFNLKDIDVQTPPNDPVRSPNTSFDPQKAAVSAHVNAMRVWDFYNAVLQRDGVDDKGMDLISYVNCTVPAEQSPPEWDNAVWYKQRMWYGQKRDGNGDLRSYARYLDVIGHELTHGVTEFTSDLVYMKESGALNESFSDIFGVIIKNWDWSDLATGGNVSRWNWEIGPGLGNGGKPLRDMKDPKRTGDPDHMNNFLKTTKDNGGVHTNSNIHNKAAYNVLTAKQGGNSVFTPRDVAVLYYLCLQRLDKLATFQQTLATLLNVAAIYFVGAPDKQQKLDAIKHAYQAVGIS